MKRFPQTAASSTLRRWRRRFRSNREGNITVLAAAMFVMIFGFTAFSVDLGFIALTRAQLQSASDGAALAAAMELPPNLGLHPTLTSDQAAEVARQASIAVAAANRAGERDSVHVDGLRDVRFGQAVWDPISGQWNKNWGVVPYNMVSVTLRRNQQVGAADGPLPLFFAPVIGQDNASLSVDGTAALLPGVGFRIPPGSTQTIGALPFTLDVETWDALVSGVQYGNGYYFDDRFTYQSSGQVVAGADGVREVNLYPEGTSDLPPGNRGTLDLGQTNNSTADIERQIMKGLNASDLSYFANSELRTDNGPLSISGDTGISAGFKEELQIIAGEPRLLPIFSKVSGNGENAVYTIIKFVGVRVMEVKLTGNPKRVIIQPCPFSDSSVIPDRSGAPVTNQTVFTSPMLID